jgi:hypothetical protein
MDKYRQNKPTEYTVVLRSALDFGNAHQDWEVALVYAQFTQGWNNVRKDCLVRLLVKLQNLPKQPVANQPPELFHREIPFNEEGTDWEDYLASTHADEMVEAANSKFKLNEWVYYRMLLRASNYPSVQAFLQHIRKHFDLAFGRFGASLDGEVDFTTGYVKLIATRCEVILLDGDTYFADILGLPTTKVQERDFSSIGSGRGRPAKLYTVDLIGTRKPKLDVLHSMYVYSDVIERQPVGDTDAPLLGIVPVGDTSPGSRVHYAFNPLIYLPVSQAYIRNIRVTLATENGDPVPFASASDNVVVCLRFRRKASSKYQIPFLL